MGARKGHKKVGGRKKGTPNKKTVEKDLLIRYLTKKIIKNKGKWVPALLKKMNEGDVRATKEGLDRIIGKATERLDVTSGGEKIYKWNVYRDNKDKKNENGKIQKGT